MSTDAIHPPAAPPPAPPPAPPESWLAAKWSTAKRLYVFLLPIRFSFLALAVVGFAFIVSAQGHDIIATMTEEDPTRTGPSHFLQRVFFVPLVTFLAIQVWYWSRTMLRLCAPEAPSAKEFPFLATWMPRLLGVLAYLIMLGALYRVGREYGKESQQPLSSLWNLAAWLAVATVLFVIFCVVRRRWLDNRAKSKNVSPEVTQQKHLQELAPSTRWILRALFLVAVAFFLASCFAVQKTGYLGSMAIVLLSLSLWVSFGSVLVYFGMRARMPVLTLLMLLALASSRFADNHVVQTLPGTATLVTARPNVEKAFRSWIDRLVKEQPSAEPYPVFIVATEGGGIRAAYWTAAVLTALDDDIPHFRDHLFAVSGVSGGSVGAAVYAALATRQAAVPGKLRPAARGILAYDALAPTLAAMTQQDFVQRFIPYPFLPDRARALEGGWEKAWSEQSGTDKDNLIAGGFLKMMQGHEDRMPSFFLNGTAVETGQRMIGSNCRITPEEFSDALDAFDAAGADLPVSTTALNSARFTYVSPAGSFLRTPLGDAGSPYCCAHGKRCEHVVDGGYFDNSGAITAAEILAVIQRIAGGKAGGEKIAIAPHVLILQYETLDQKPEVQKQDTAAAKPPVTKPTVKPERWANEILSPVRALLSTRNSRAVLAVSQIKMQLAQQPGADGVLPFTLGQYPDTVPMPLGWLLSLQTRSEIDAQMGPQSEENGHAMEIIAKMLHSSLSSDETQERAAKAPEVHSRRSKRR